MVTRGPVASSIATGRDLVTAPGSPPQTRPPEPQLGPPRLSSGVFQAVRVLTGSSRGGSGRRRSARGRAPGGPCGRGVQAEPAPRWLQPRAPRPQRRTAHDGHAAPAVPGPPPPSRGPVDLERLPGSGRGSQARECPLLPAAPGPGGGTRALVPPAGLGPGAAGGPAGPSGALARTEPARALPRAARALSHAVNGAAGDRVPLELRAPRVLSVRVSQCDPVAPTRPSQLPGPRPLPRTKTPSRGTGQARLALHMPLPSVLGGRGGHRASGTGTPALRPCRSAAWLRCVSAWICSSPRRPSLPRTRVCECFISALRVS